MFYINYQLNEDDEPLTVPIPDTSPNEGASLPDTGNSWYDPDSSFPEIHEEELEIPEDPKAN